MMKKHRSPRHSHKIKIQIKSRPRTRSVMATDRQKHIKRMEEIKGKGLTRTNEAEAILVEPRNRLQQQRRFCKNKGLRAVLEEKLKQWQIRRRRTSFREEKEQEDGKKK